jgi:predicted component of type VI protein secretion system
MVIEESARTPRTVFDSGSTPKKRLVAWLVTFVDNPAGQAYRLNEGTNTIGSDRECDLAFPHEPSIGRRHAVIVARHGKLLIQEGESSRLITVNGVGIAGRGALPLKNLDRIRIGLMDFRLHTVT